jgi:cell division FtsZ-interacting protein ZapD
MKQPKKARSTGLNPELLKELDQKIEEYEKKYGIPQVPEDYLETMFRNQYRMNQSGQR